jgi:hypothetical protein
VIRCNTPKLFVYSVILYNTTTAHWKAVNRLYLYFKSQVHWRFIISTRASPKQQKAKTSSIDVQGLIPRGKIGLFQVDSIFLFFRSLSTSIFTTKYFFKLNNEVYFLSNNWILYMQNLCSTKIINTKVCGISRQAKFV